MLAAVGRSSRRTARHAVVAGLLVAVAFAGAGPAAAVPAANASRVLTTMSSPIGKVLVDSRGRTVYVFAADRAGKSTCSGACLRAWPAVVAPATLPGSLPGVTGTLGVLARADGKRQLTINGQPLYLFSGDSAKADIKGQGVNGFGARWWAVAPSGKANTTMPPGSGSAGGSDGGSSGGSNGGSGSDDYGY